MTTITAAPFAGLRSRLTTRSRRPRIGVDVAAANAIRAAYADMHARLDRLEQQLDELREDNRRG